MEWTRVETPDYILFTRSDGLAGYKIWKHGHLHAEQWMPWEEGLATSSKADTTGKQADWFSTQLAALGDKEV